MLQGDAPMDSLVARMYEFGPGPGPGPACKLFQQAVQHGIRSVADAPQPLPDFFAEVDQEPLARTYPNFPEWRGKIAYHQHLSLSRYFLGKQKMAQLGLPDNCQWPFILTHLWPIKLTHYG